MKIFLAIALLTSSFLLIGCIFDDYDNDQPLPQEVIDAANAVPQSPFPRVNVTSNRSTVPILAQNNSPAMQNTSTSAEPQLPALQSNVSASRLPVAQVDQTLVDFQNIPRGVARQQITVSQSDYATFIDDAKIKTAIGDLTAEERSFLLASASELETSNTAQWAEYDSGNSGTYVLTKSEARRVWLRRIAKSLHVELHKEVPWSLRDYGTSDLTYLLSFCTEDYAELSQLNYAGFIHYPCQQFFKKPNPNYENYEMLLIWEPNPADTIQITKSLLGDFRPVDQSGLVDAIVLTMRQMDWGHVSSAEDQQYLTNGIPGDVTTMNRLYSLKRGGSGWNSVFMAAILRYYNVPAEVGEVNGHGYVQFPTVDKAMFSGDWVQGWPKELPIENSYVSNGQMQYYFSLPVCNSQTEVDKIKLRRILSIYNNRTMNEKVYYGLNGFCTIGREYVPYLIARTKSTDRECIDGSQPNKGKWTPPFDQSEIDQWTSTLQTYADQTNICT
ncbi:MAG: hypothetical protein Q8R15_01050 [Candidatus Micrarchaeota archaeon]|nr:hypothetical protein [Candidatus Micrarchaeota archaeon]